MDSEIVLSEQTNDQCVRSIMHIFTIGQPLTWYVCSKIIFCTNCKDVSFSFAGIDLRLDLSISNHIIQDFFRSQNKTHISPCGCSFNIMKPEFLIQILYYISHDLAM